MIIPVVETERLILREWRESDLENFAKFKLNKQAAQFVMPSETIGEAWRAMAYFAGHWLLRGYGNWSVERKDSGDHIGYCGTYFPMEWPEPEIGWCIYPEHQRQGYATEAAIAALTHAYTKLNWKTAISLIADENGPSIALAKRMGAVAESQITYRNFQCTIYRHLSPSNFLKH